MSEPTDLEKVQERRAARKAGSNAKRDEQKAIDLKAIDELEEEYGDSCISVVEIGYNPVNPLPVLLAVRCPKPSEMKRYRDQIKPKKKDGVIGDPMAAASALATVCLVYPEKDIYEKVKEARPGVHVQLGTEAVNLSVGTAESEGKG